MLCWKDTAKPWTGPACLSPSEAGLRRSFFCNYIFLLLQHQHVHQGAEFSCLAPFTLAMPEQFCSLSTGAIYVCRIKKQ